MVINFYYLCLSSSCKNVAFDFDDFRNIQNASPPHLKLILVDLLESRNQHIFFTLSSSCVEECRRETLCATSLLRVAFSSDSVAVAFEYRCASSSSS